MFGIALGHEDVVDHDHLRQDPVLATLAGKLTARRNNCAPLTSLTTTGYGDVLLKGMDGRLLSIAIMIIGISLFLRLVQTVFRPRGPHLHLNDGARRHRPRQPHGKVRFPCPRCGLQRHDLDAVHCKACGLLLAIPNDEP
jgi:voltage-gated potassium channel